jgi:hypothetical protein
MEPKNPGLLYVKDVGKDKKPEIMIRGRFDFVTSLT